MASTKLIPIREKLERNEKKLDGSFSNKFLSISQVIAKSELKCNNKLGKLLFKVVDVDKWVKGDGYEER